jgi:spermidine synthase
MKPRIKIAETQPPGGGSMVLYEHDGDYSISFNGQELMHAKAHASELHLGELGVAEWPEDMAGRVLIGGLGLGFTLHSVLDLVNAQSEVDVYELIPDVVQWNRDFLKTLNGALLEDDRVTVHIGDVCKAILEAEPGTWDVILMDIDNGPVAMVAGENQLLYADKGIQSIRKALRRKGRAVFWSAGPDIKFETRLKRNGFKVQAIPTKRHPSARQMPYRLFVADRS